MKKSIVFVLLLLLINLQYSCTLPNQPGPMPRELEKIDAEKKLTVFALLRADNIPGSSFIHITRTLTIEELYDENYLNPFISTAQVTITDLSNQNQFLFHPSSDTSKNGYYYNEQFLPEPGRRYHLTVTDSGFPEVTGETTVPERIQIISASLENHGNDTSLNFSFDPGKACAYLNIFLIASDYFKTIDMIPEQTLPVKINLNIESQLSQVTIKVFSFDLNYYLYYNNPIAFIPQSYHQVFTSLEGGYGVLAAVTVDTLILNNSSEQ